MSVLALAIAGAVICVFSLRFFGIPSSWYGMLGFLFVSGHTLGLGGMWYGDTFGTKKSILPPTGLNIVGWAFALAGTMLAGPVALFFGADRTWTFGIILAIQCFLGYMAFRVLR